MSSPVVGARGPEVLTGRLGVKARASSVLRGSPRQFGPLRMFDGSCETCWNSDHSSAGQWLELAFSERAHVQAVAITFQGGFVGQDGAIFVRATPADEWRPAGTFVPDDSNAEQTFPLSGAGAAGVTGMRLTFERSTDFYGRVTIYKLDVLGAPRAT